MKIIPVEQGTVEWLIARQGLITGTDFHACIGGKAALDTLVLIKAADMIYRLYVKEEPRQVTAGPLEWGKENEPAARQLYEFVTGLTVKTVGFVQSYADNLIGFSPDGLVDPDGLIEIKCPQTLREHIRHIEIGLPKQYEAQVHGGLWVSGRQWCDFISYHPDMPGEKQLWIKRICRDENYISTLSDAVLNVAFDVREILDHIYPEWRNLYEYSR